MSSRLDERSSVRELLELPDLPHPLETLGKASAEPRTVPTRALAGAMSGWMALVFAVCYLGLPVACAALGLWSDLLVNVLFNLPSFVLSSLVVVVFAAVVRPDVRTDLRAARDPVISAALGGLLTWAVIHNTSPLLRHFDDFGAMELLSFVFVNVVEMSMIGMMLASFTRTRAAAFGLGASFQLLVLGMFLALAAL